MSDDEVSELISRHQHIKALRVISSDNPPCMR
jgi:hypothetical protein